MLEELRWKTSVSTTCLHAAACRATGLAAADDQLASILDPAADALANEIAAAGWPVPEMLHELTGLASELDNNGELVKRAITRLHLPMADVTAPVRIAGAIADLEAAMQRAAPALAEELAVRIRPIREQWEARGPGLLMEIARLTEPLAVPSAAEIVLVAPYVGGAGSAYASANRVVLEAVLFNPLPELPEAVRLAWLLSQLNADLPWMTDVMPPAQARGAMKLAMIPPVLAAAEAVELAHCDELTLAAAIAAWLPGVAAEDAAPKIWTWWNAWLDHATKWPVAVAALEQLTLR
ncbi:MAG: hypothetical protein H0T51_09490 [Pirellulales bacterium]|nr:hypothetical protein [Pirellulales bacterium]